MPVSPDQLAANQANSQKSTGPRTPAGKERSRLNAFRHCITAQVINMPPEIAAAYLSFNKQMVEACNPYGFIEKQIAQTIADTQWRLNRFCAHETNLFALGHQENSNVIDVDDEAIHAALTAAATLRANLGSCTQ